MPYNDQQLADTGSFAPTTYVWDMGSLDSIDINSQEFKDLLVRLYQNLCNMANVLNTKETGLHSLEEFNASKPWFNPNSSSYDNLRSSFRKVIDTGALGALANKTIPHGLAVTATWLFTFIGGAATRNSVAPFLFYPLPFAERTGANIEVRADSTNIYIANGTAIAFDSSYIVLEYLKY